MIEAMDPGTINPDKNIARVLRTMQSTRLPKPQHNTLEGASGEGQSPRSRSAIRLVNNSSKAEPLEHYSLKPPTIKVSLGHGLNMVVYQIGEKVGVGTGPNADLNVASM